MNLKEKHYILATRDDLMEKSGEVKIGFLVDRKELVQLLTLARMYQGPIDSFLKKEGIKYLD